MNSLTASVLTDFTMDEMGFPASEEEFPKNVFVNHQTILDFLADLMEIIKFEIQRLRAKLPQNDARAKLNHVHTFILRDQRSLVRCLGTHLLHYLYQPHARYQLPCNLHFPWGDSLEEDNRVPVPTLVDFAEIFGEGVEEDVRHRCESAAVPRSPELPYDLPRRYVHHIKSPPRISTPNASDFLHVPQLPNATNYSAVIGANHTQMGGVNMLIGRADDFHTAVGGVSALIGSEDADSTKKIADLETQLEELKKQMAAIVMMKERDRKEKAPVQHKPSNRSRSSSGSCDSGISGGEQETARGSGATGAKGAPPPAPPPPPPPPPPPVSALQSTPNRLQIRRRTGAATGTEEATKKPKQMTLADVLKDLHTVKLKPVNRSPGGTPSRRPRRSNAAMPSDPGAFIAEALRKKFEHAYGSPVSSEMDNASLNNSFDNSFDAEFSPSVMTRRLSRRRSSLKPVFTNDQN